MKSIRPVNIERRDVDMVICLERGADYLHMIQLMPLHSKPRHLLPRLNPDFFYLSCICLPFFVSAYPGCPGKEAVKQV